MPCPIFASKRINHIIGDRGDLGYDVLPTYQCAEFFDRDGSFVTACYRSGSHQHKFRTIILVGEGNLEAACLRIGHASDDRIDRIHLQIGDEGFPFGLDDFDFFAKFFGQPLGDLDVIAIGIGAGVIGNGQCKIVCPGIADPIKGNISTLKTNANLIGVLVRIAAGRKQAGGPCK